MHTERYFDEALRREIIERTVVTAPNEEALRSTLSQLHARAIARPGIREVRQRVIGRNDPCPCGSGAKFKKCCLRDADDSRFAEQVQGETE